MTRDLWRRYENLFIRSEYFIMATSSINSSSEETNDYSSAEESTEGTGSDPENTLAGCEGIQPYMFEPYDSEASSDNSNSSSESASEDEIHERLQNTDWYVHLR